MFEEETPNPEGNANTDFFGAFEDDNNAEGGNGAGEGESNPIAMGGGGDDLFESEPGQKDEASGFASLLGGASAQQPIQLNNGTLPVLTPGFGDSGMPGMLGGAYGGLGGGIMTVAFGLPSSFPGSGGNRARKRPAKGRGGDSTEVHRAAGSPPHLC